MTKIDQTAPPTIERAALGKFGIAQENPRVHLPPDDDIPTLWASIKAAGQVYPVLARAGAKGELEFMALDGRRRIYAFEYAKSIGEADDETPIEYILVTDKNRQIAAAYVAAMQTLQTHKADIIRSIGVLRGKKRTTSQIAHALGVPTIEIDRLGALSALPETAINCLRKGQLTLKQCQLLTKVRDDGTLAALIDQAIAGQISDRAIELSAANTVVTIHDPRVSLVTIDGYRKAGGRIEQDLFGTDDVLLDPDKLQSAWMETAKPVGKALQDLGLTTLLAAERYHGAPDGFEVLDPTARYRLTDEEREAHAEAEAQALKKRNALYEAELGAEKIEAVIDLALATFEAAKLANPSQTIGAVSLSPDHNFGLGYAFFALPKMADPSPEPESPQQADQQQPPAIPTDNASSASASDEAAIAPRTQPSAVPAVEPSVVQFDARTNPLHERYTDLATRGLIRAVADNPIVGLNLVIARMFAETIADPQHDAAKTGSTIVATAYRRNGHEPIANLDGAVYDDLKAAKSEFLASGKSLLGWIADMNHGDKMILLAKAAAISLDYREANTRIERAGARAEAAELAEMTDYDFTTYGTPPIDFFEAHDKPSLLKHLDNMDVDNPAVGSLKKTELAIFVAEQAAERNWAPQALSWRTAYEDVGARSPRGDEGDQAKGGPSEQDAAA